MNMASILPWPYRLLFAALVAVVLVAFGWEQGAKRVQARFDRYKSAVEAAGQAQAEKTAAITETQKTLTAQSEASYAQGDSALRNLYGPGRVRQPRAGGRAMPAVPVPAAVADAGTADAGSGAARPAPDQSQCAGLVADAAVTTRQLLFLQDWVEQQGRAAAPE